MFQDEAEIIARFIRFMRDQSGSISSESEIPSSISSYLPAPTHTYEDNFTPSSFVDDSEPYSSDSNPNHSISVLDLSDQSSPISADHNSSEENLQSTRDQTRPINTYHKSSEGDLHSIGSDQSKETSSIVCKVDQSI